jgi:hypothetical protein
MRKSWQPTPQECELIIGMLEANRPKSAIAKFLYISERTLRRFLVRAGRLATLAQNEGAK